MRRCGFALCPTSDADETVTLASGDVIVVCREHRIAVLAISDAAAVAASRVRLGRRYQPRHAA